MMRFLKNLCLLGLTVFSLDGCLLQSGVASSNDVQIIEKQEHEVSGLKIVHLHGMVRTFYLSVTKVEVMPLGNDVLVKVYTGWNVLGKGSREFNVDIPVLSAKERIVFGFDDGKSGL